MPSIKFVIKTGEETKEYFINNHQKSLPLPEIYQTIELLKSMVEEADYAIVVGYGKGKQPQSIVKSYSLERKDQSLIIYTSESDKELFSKVECIVFMKEKPTKEIENDLKKALGYKDYKGKSDLYRHMVINSCLSKYRKPYYDKNNILSPVLVPNGPALAKESPIVSQSITEIRLSSDKSSVALDKSTKMISKPQTLPSNDVQSSSRKLSATSIISKAESNISSQSSSSTVESTLPLSNDQPPQAGTKRSVWKKVLIGMGIGLGTATVITAVAGALLLTGGIAATPIIVAGAAVGHFLGITSVTTAAAVGLSIMSTVLMSASSATGGLMGGVVARFQSRSTVLNPATANTLSTATIAKTLNPTKANKAPAGNNAPVLKQIEPPVLEKSSPFRNSVHPNVHLLQNKGSDATLDANDQQERGKMQLGIQ